MRRVATFLSTTAMLAFLAASVYAKPRAQSWTGWISDSSCAAKGMAASHKDCALACVHKKGAKWVFVNSETKQVFPIQNQRAVVDSDVGEEVRLTGELKKNHSIHVENIEPTQ